MPFIDLKEVAQKEIIPGAKAKMVHSEEMTMSLWEFRRGVELPEHSHPNEQITKLISGEFEMTVNGETKLLTKDTAVVIPSGAVHSGKALTNCYIIDIFHPVREDYR